VFENDPYAAQSGHTPQLPAIVWPVGTDEPSDGPMARDKPSGQLQGRVALAILTVLLVGFANSTVETFSAYRRIFQRPGVSGRSATIDALIAPACAAAEDLRQAVERAGWAPGDTVVFLAAASAIGASVIRDDVFLRYSTAASYLLYPRPLWVARWCDPAASPAHCKALGALSDPAALVSRHQARHVLLYGASNPFSNALTRPLSDSLTLVDLQ
jgi:hypothetical protein